MMPRVTAGPTLVTGAAGFAGRHLVARLAGKGPLIGWHRPGRDAPDIPGVTWHAIDLVDREAVVRAISRDKPTRIYHLAGSPHVGSSWQTVVPQLRTNVLGTHHLLDAVRLAKTPCRVLVVSSAQIYRPGDEPIDESAQLGPATPYGMSKLACEELARQSAIEDGLDIVIARPFNHAGPGQSDDFVVSSFARQIARIEAGELATELSVGNLETRRDLTDVRDVAHAYESLMTGAAKARPYNVCSGRAWRIGDLLDELIHASHAKVTVRVDESRFRPHDATVIQGDASRIRAELGWMPEIRIEQMLRDTLDWWRRTIPPCAP